PTTACVPHPLTDYSPVLPPALHAFPTRRSSDLAGDAHLRRRFAGEHGDGIFQLRTLPLEIDRLGARAFELRLRLHHVGLGDEAGDRKSTRLNSSHVKISYAVFCLKKKKELEARS